MIERNLRITRRAGSFHSLDGSLNQYEKEGVDIHTNLLRESPLPKLLYLSDLATDKEGQIRNNFPKLPDNH